MPINYSHIVSIIKGKFIDLKTKLKTIIDIDFDKPLSKLSSITKNVKNTTKKNTTKAILFSNIDQTFNRIKNGEFEFTDKHKAMLITFFISGSLLMMAYNLSLKQHEEEVIESYYEMNPEKLFTEEELKLLEALDNLNGSKAETNTAFNEYEKSNHFAQAYKDIAPPEDFIEEEESELEGEESEKQNYEPIEKDQIDEEEKSKFEKVNELLNKKDDLANNGKSTISFSLKGRKKRYIPIPVYLCEVSGVIIIDIQVNSRGQVINTRYNKSSRSSNECLIEHAIQYAKKARFSADDSKPTQSGSITYNFIGKR